MFVVDVWTLVEPSALEDVGRQAVEAGSVIASKERHVSCAQRSSVARSPATAPAGATATAADIATTTATTAPVTRVALRIRRPPCSADRPIFCGRPTRASGTRGGPGTRRTRRHGRGRCVHSPNCAACGAGSVRPRVVGRAT